MRVGALGFFACCDGCGGRGGGGGGVLGDGVCGSMVAAVVVVEVAFAGACSLFCGGARSNPAV